MNKSLNVVLYFLFGGFFATVLFCSLYVISCRRERNIQGKDVFSENVNQLFLLDSFGLSRYECTGSCYCEDGESEYRRIASVIPKHGFKYLFSAASGLLAYRLASDYFTEKCEETFGEDDCQIISEVESCNSVVVDDEEDELSSEKEESGDESTNKGDEPKCVLCVGFYDYGFNFHPYSKTLQKLIEEGKHDSNYKVEHFGISGECTREMLPRCKRVYDRISQEMDVSHVIILGGSNDCGYGEDADYVVGNLQCMFTHCMQKEDTLGFSVQVPTNEFDTMERDYRDLKKEYNEKLRLYCEESERLYLVDLGDYAKMSPEERAKYWESDKLHYTKEGYDMLAKKIFKVLKDHL